MAKSMGVVAKLASGATESDDRATVTRLARRRACALSRLLGVTAAFPQRDGWGRSVFVHRHQCRPEEKQPSADLERRLGQLVALRHRAGQRVLDDERIFTLPPWLAISPKRLKRMPATPLQIHLHPSSSPVVTIHAAWTSRQLRGVVLSTRLSALWRRRCIVESATSLLRDMGRVLGAPPSGSKWLRDMTSDPGDAEAEAIEVWNACLEAVKVPRGLRIPGSELSLVELLAVCGEAAGRHERRWFANQWPAAVSALFRNGSAKQAFRRIEQNRAAAVRVATAAYCCSGQEECEKAARLARVYPKYSHDLVLARVLSGDDSRVERQVRAILAEANHESGGELLRRMAHCSVHAREQMELANDVATQPVFDITKCRIEIGKLIARTLAGSEIGPEALDPAVGCHRSESGRCLGRLPCHIRRRALGGPYRASAEGAGSLETGVLPMVALLSRSGWRLSPSQFIRFIDWADRHAAHHTTLVRHEFPDCWQPPPGWSEDLHAHLDGGLITPLCSIRAIRAEGDAMDNCLRERMFDRPVLLGQLSLCSIRFGRARATLSLNAVETTEPSSVRVDSYQIQALRRRRNASPSRGSRKIARLLVEQLNSRLPVVLPIDEARRRQTVRAFVNQLRSFNTDREAAKERWHRLFVGGLPKRLRRISPSLIVDAMMTGGHLPAL